MSQTARFCAAEDEELIELVGGHPILWELKNPEYKNTVKKEVIWADIGNMINKTSKYLLE